MGQYEQITVLNVRCLCCIILCVISWWRYRATVAGRCRADLTSTAGGTSKVRPAYTTTHRWQVIFISTTVSLTLDRARCLHVELHVRCFSTGVTSWGYDCGQPRWPGIYTDVSVFSDWVRQVASNLSLPLLDPPSVTHREDDWTTLNLSLSPSRSLSRIWLVKV